MKPEQERRPALLVGRDFFKIFQALALTPYQAKKD